VAGAVIAPETLRATQQRGNQAAKARYADAMRARSVLAASLFALGGALAFALVPRATPARAESTPSGSAAPVVALLATQPSAGTTSLYLARAGESTPSLPVASFPHLPGAVVRGAVLPAAGAVLATADTAATRDASFNASLFRVDPRHGSTLLCDRIVHASRPLVTPAGRVFVARGVAGPALEGAMRVDALTVDEIDPFTGQAWTVHAYAGYLTFLAAAVEDDLLVYRVGPDGADLVRVDPDTFEVRPVLASMPPFARDFSLNPATNTLVFQERDETDSHLWVVDQLDLTTRARTRVATGPSPTFSPHALADGRVLYNAGTGGLQVLGQNGAVAPQKGAVAPQRGAVAPQKIAVAPLGPGVNVIEAEQGGWIAGRHTVAGQLPQGFALEVATGRVAALAAPPGTRVAVAGFMPPRGER
jgi:hypothetical protein